MAMADLYPQIFKRKSIRNYDLTPLEDGVLENIIEEINNLEPLYADIKVDFKIISQNDVNPRMMKKAPHYIAVFSENKEGYKTNVGFMLQQMDIFFSANGLGSCWQGIPKTKKNVLESSNLEFVILMAFGKANIPLHRTSTLEFKRKPLPQITDIRNKGSVGALLEAARLAPSATNSQPWFFKGNNHVIHAYVVKPNIFRAIMLKKYIMIDMGIVIYHLKLASEHFGKTSQIIFDETADENSPHGYEYVASLKIE
ncbi:nitroreductase family protein [Methanobacterium sp.]|uniref:nitroreductase family protein n=1 Tax=Methanobacterium sp. TaxID=2164 RepID=UPI0025F87103|nr:nitroreductase family protein [Methanobacterium sp.]MBI5458426.1 nitroreductase [Methanobacterium sp.]